MLSLDIAFYRSKARNWLRTWVWRLRYSLSNQSASGSVLLKSGGFEEEIEQQMRAITKESLGLEVGDDAFDG